MYTSVYIPLKWLHFKKKEQATYIKESLIVNEIIVAYP